MGKKKKTSNINSIYDRLTISKAMLQMRNQNWKFQELLENFSWEILSLGTRGSELYFIGRREGTVHRWRCVTTTNAWRVSLEIFQLSKKEKDMHLFKYVNNFIGISVKYWKPVQNMAKIKINLSVMIILFSSLLCFIMIIFGEKNISIEQF